MTTDEPCGARIIATTYWPDRSYHQSAEKHVVTCTKVLGHGGDHSHQWGNSRMRWEQEDNNSL